MTCSCKCSIGITLVCLSLALAGCRDKAKPVEEAGEEPTTTSKPGESAALKEAAKEAGLDEEKPGAAEVMVKATYDRKEREQYTFDRDCPHGTIRGSSAFAKSDKLALPPEQDIDFAGPFAIKAPRPKELEFYKNIGLKKPLWFVEHDKGKHSWFQPINVVVTVPNIKKGIRPPLERAVMCIREGAIIPGDNANFGANNVQFCPQHERLQLTTWDQFPSHMVVTQVATGKVIFEADVAYATDPGQKESNLTADLQYKPTLVATPPLRELGLYTVVDARHPWIKGYLFVVDTPYVFVTRADHYDKRSNFDLAGLPPGKHTLQVWHPDFQPVNKTVEVEVEQDKSKEVMLEFVPPTGE